MDNRVFDINGKGQDGLTKVLDLAMWHRSGCYKFDKPETAEGYTIDPAVGLILLSNVDEKNILHHKFIAPLNAEALAGMVMAWLNTDEAKAIPPQKWDDDCDHDGHNSQGWRVFCGGWGHTGTANWRAIVGIRPVFLWHGK